MSHAPEALADTFQKHNVLKIAIVDDGYDPPDPAAIIEQRWLAFRVAVDDAKGSLGVHSAVLTEIGGLPTYGSLRSEPLQKLWQHLAGLELGDKPTTEQDLIAQSLKGVFQSFSANRIAKLRQLRHVERAAFDATGQDATCFPSTAAPASLKDFDLIFMDFFLGDETDSVGERLKEKLSSAQENACRLVREVSQAAKPNNAPLFVVISSLATNDNVPQFRESAELLASKFRFLSKDDIEKDITRRDFVLKGLVSQRAAGDSIEKLTSDWQQSITLALDDMMKSVRRLDLADYAYLQTYRLTDEKVSLLNYLTWLYNGYLGSFVEERLAGTDPELAKPLADFTKPSAVLRPMSEIPRIYSRITTTKVKDFGDEISPKVWTGDLFVRRSVLSRYAATLAVGPDTAAPHGHQTGSPNPATTAGNLSLELDRGESADNGGPAQPQAGEIAAEATTLPDVVATITPVCDLVPGRIKAKTVMLMGGDLTELGKAKQASNHLLVYDRPGSTDDGVEFLIDWNSKWPLAFPISAFDGEGVSGTDYVRVTRLRELYAAEVAQSMAADLARVGVPVAPPFTRPLDVQVRICGQKAPILDTIGVARRPYAWDLHRKKTGSARELVFSESFLWDLRSAVREKSPSEHGARALVDDLANLEALLQPFSATSKYPNPAQKKILVREETGMPSEVPKPGNTDVIVISVFGINE